MINNESHFSRWTFEARSTSVCNTAHLINLILGSILHILCESYAFNKVLPMIGILDNRNVGNLTFVSTPHSYFIWNSKVNIRFQSIMTQVKREDGFCDNIASFHRRCKQFVLLSLRESCIASPHAQDANLAIVHVINVIKGSELVVLNATCRVFCDTNMIRCQVAFQVSTIAICHCVFYSWLKKSEST